MYQQVYDYLQNGKYPDEFSKSQKRGLRRRSQDFVVQDGVLFYQGKISTTTPETDPKQKQQILEGCHSSQLPGHFGRDKTREKASKLFYYFFFDDVCSIYRVVYLCNRK